VANPTHSGSEAAQAVVTGYTEGEGGLTGRVGSSEFPIGGPDGSGRIYAGPNPYELLSASLAACSALTLRMHARHKGYPLSHVEVAVSYHHASDGERGAFERSITLEGGLNDSQRAELLRGVNACPVGRTLGVSAEIRTTSLDQPKPGAVGWPADYTADLETYSIVNIDPD
jgi:putative redox protein